jgi:hypothetical protein
MENLIFPDDRVEPSAAVWVSASAVLFLLVCLVTAGIDTAAPIEVKLQGGEAIAEAKRAADAKFFDGTAAAHLERQVRKRSRTQAFLGPFATGLFLKLGRLPDSDARSLSLGRDGWIFLKDRSDYPSRLQASAPLSIPRFVRAMDVRLRRAGHRLILAPIPRKAAIAYEMLDGDASELELDQALFKALELSQVDMINILGPMRALKPNDAYIKNDTHWAEGGVQLFVETLRGQFGKLRAGEDVVVEQLSEPVDREADLLKRMRIVRGHPATESLFDLPTRVIHRVEPPDMIRPFRKQTEFGLATAEVVHVGTSFSGTSTMSARLAAAFQCPILSAVGPGSPALKTLGQWATSYLDAGLAQTVIVEIPLYQVLLLARQHGPMMKGTVELFRSTPSDAMEEWSELQRSVTIGELRQQPMVLPVGTLLTSGDGAVYVEVELTSSRPSTLRVLTGHISYPVKLEKGTPERIVLPWIEPAGNVGSLQLQPDRLLPPETEVRVRVLADPAAEGVEAIPMNVATASSWEADLAGKEIGRDDFIDLSWSGGEGTAAVLLTGKGRDGKPLVRRFACQKMASHRARILCTPFAGGEVSSVAFSLEGAANVAATLGTLDLGKK